VKGFLPLYKRELFAMFVTPLAWVIIVAFLVIQGMHFTLLVSFFSRQVEVSVDNGPVQAFFGQTIFLYLPLLVLCPGLTMRMFAEERRSGTIETLLTAPVSTPAVVLSKYAAALTTYVAMWLPTLLYMVVLRRTGEIDWRVVGSGYLGVLGVGSGYLAVGLLMSALTKSQLLALVLSTMVNLALFTLGIGEMLGDQGVFHAIAEHVSVWSQMDDFSKGIIDTRRLVYDVTVSAVPLFATVRIVDAWRWG
jgi:ABC-2 type transport system permease protein